ncbi:A kinase (PRKA) anchor protein 1b [Anguilla rostrata]|uniref:A kinase (PRKA) anchor protein 1b n=1 Tax=Anguilla rostrata TaxID=7938 RepID=UPI0030CF500A
MPLRFRSFVPYTLPGVLALIGWWWYISRKKGRITSHDSEEGAVPGALGLLSSPSEGSNGTAERGPRRKPSRGRFRVQEEPPLGQEVTAEVHAPLCAAGERADVPAPSPSALPLETGGGEAAGHRNSDLRPVAAETAEAKVAHPRPEKGDAGAGAGELPPGAQEAAGDADSSAVAIAGSGRVPVAEAERSTSAAPDAAQASAVRPEPEGEVAADRTPVPCADAPPSKEAPKPALQAPIPAQQAPLPAQQAPIPAQQAPKPAQQAPIPAQQAPNPPCRPPTRLAGPHTCSPFPATQPPQAPIPPCRPPYPPCRPPYPPCRPPYPPCRPPYPPSRPPNRRGPSHSPCARSPKPALQAPKPALQAPIPALQAPIPALQAPKPAQQAPIPAQQAPVSTETLVSATAAPTTAATMATSVAALPPSAPPVAAAEAGRLGPAQENGLAAAGAEEEPAEGAGSAGEIERLAAGLITEVILAAAQEVLIVSRGEGGAGGRALCHSQKDEEEEEEGEESGVVWEPSSSTPVTNGRPCASRDTPTEESPPSKGRSESGMEEGGSSLSSTTNLATAAGLRLSDAGGEELNGCLAPPSWEEPAGPSQRVEPGSPAPCAEATPPSLSKLRAEDGVVGGAAAAEDSGCSTCQSEDGASSEDLLHSTGLSCPAPAGRDRLLHLSGICRGRTPEGPGGRGLEGAGLNGAGLGNGTLLSGETEADHSGGSDVNSMDSVDSGCTLGAGDGPSGSTQSSELIIWEIEVPKHLVGRLIGKQGRYVSFLKQSSGAKIYISTLPYTQEFQICHIEGTQQQVDKALALIGKKFKDLDLTNLYAPPPLPLTLPSLPMTSWLLLPNGVTVEVIVVNIVSAGHVFVQQHTHPTYHALRSLDQQMFLCYSQPGTPALPSPAEVGVICAAPAVEGAWWRAQVISFYKDSGEVEIRYVDYGGYDRVKIDTLRQIRSDFVTLPFQGAEVLLDNIAPLPGEERFSADASSALEEMTRGVALLAQVTNYDNNTGLPLVQMWNMVGEELVSVNRTLAERGFGTWVDSF